MEIKDRSVRTWKVEPLELLEEQKVDQFSLPEIVFDISRDGRFLCGASGDGTIELRDFRRGTVVSPGKFADVIDACFSPRGDRVLIREVGPHGVYEYDAVTGAHIRDYSDGRPASMCYSADGQRIAVASEMGFISIHDAVTGEETLRLDGGGHALVFASDGTSLLGNGAPDGGLYHWPGLSTIQRK
jgi:WD40 repeat protein